MEIRPVQEWHHRINRIIGYTTMVPFAGLTYLFTRLRNEYYRYIGKRHFPRKPVIIVGSVFVGGSGKTPITEWLALECIRRGFRPAVVSGGFRKRSSGEIIVYDGQRILASAENAGDEAMMMALHFIERSASIPVVSGKNRINALRLIDERFDADMVILDDGLQYMKLRADMEIAVMDIERLRKKNLPLPLGSMRDSMKRLKNVNSLLISKIPPGESSGGDLAIRMKRYTRAETVLDSFYIPHYLKTWPDNNRINEKELNNRQVVLFSGLASNRPFFRMAENMLKPMQSTIIRRLGFPDHHWYTRADCRKLFAPFQELSGICWLTTEKDAVRLKNEWIPGAVTGKLFILTCRTVVAQSDFWIDAILNRLFSSRNRGDSSTQGETDV